MTIKNIPPISRHRFKLAAVLCLGAMFAVELICSVRQQSQTWDEACHIFAGLEYWRNSDFGVNPEHPPLIKLLASSPLLTLRLQNPPLPQGYFRTVGFYGGRNLLYANDADELLFRARLASSLLALLLVLLLFEAVYRVFGPGPAFLALGFAVFEPNMLAHGALVTTDTALACFLFASVYSFYRYVKQPSVRRLVECGFTVGLTLAAKHSGILIFPILGLLGLAELLSRRGIFPGPHSPPEEKVEGGIRRVLQMGASLLAMASIAVAVLWAFYSFRFQARPGDLKMTPSLAEYVPNLKSPTTRWAILTTAKWRLLPESYLYGLADVALANEGRPAFILGRLFPHGRWFYFPVVFLVKSTLGFLGLLVLALGARLLRRTGLHQEVLLFTIPAGLYFLVVLTSGLNLGVRHLLPVYPFLLSFAAVGAWSLIEERRSWAYVVGALLAFHLVSSLRSFPNYLAYSNEIWGGTAKTYRALTDSDVDWGQSLKATARYLERRRITECWLAYNGSADPDYYHIPCKLLPDLVGISSPATQIAPPVAEGTVLVSATQTSGTLSGPAEMNPYAQFLQTPPVDNIGGSILVFRGRFELPLAAAISHVNKAWELRGSNKLDQALAEARMAVALAPRHAQGHVALAYLLAEEKRTSEAHQEYQTALDLAQRIHPEYQEALISFLQQELSRF